MKHDQRAGFHQFAEAAPEFAFLKTPTAHHAQAEGFMHPKILRARWGHDRQVVAGLCVDQARQLSEDV